MDDLPTTNVADYLVSRYNRCTYIIGDSGFNSTAETSTTHFVSSWRACESTDYHNSLYLILTMGFILTTIHCLILTMSSSSPQFTLSHPDHEFHPLHNSLCLILTSVRVPIPTTHLISSWPWVHPHHNSLYLILTHFFSSWRAWGYRSPQFTVSLWPWVPSSLTSSHPDEREGTDHHN